MSDRVARCRDCVFYDSSTSDCHRCPPSFVLLGDDKVTTLFPRVEEDDWCGEFKDRHELAGGYAQ
jgi:hypothetical protein